MAGFKLFTQQIRALIWKGYIVRKRHPISSTFELLVPIILAGLLVYGSAHSPPIVSPNYSKPYIAGEVVPVTMSPIIDFNMTLLKVLNKKTIFYTPENEETTQIMMGMQECLKKISKGKLSLKYKGVPGPTDFNIAWYNMTAVEQLQMPGFIEFNAVSGFSNINGTFGVTFHQSGMKFPSLTRKWREKDKSGPIGLVNDYNQGFMQLQMILNEAYLTMRAHNLSLAKSPPRCTWPGGKEINIQTRRMPYPGHRVVAQNQIIDQTPMVLAYGIAISFSFLIFRTCQEKSTGSREMLTMAGLNQFAYWFSNFMNAYIFISILSLIQLTIIFLPFNGSSSALFANSSYFLIICLVQLFITHTILFGQLITIPFNKPVVGTCVSLVIFAITFTIPDTFLNGTLRQSVNGHDRRLSCFLPNSALVWTFRIISQREVHGFGLNFHSLNDSVDVYDDLTVLHVILVQLTSCVLYMILIWYLDHVWPWQPGIPRPFYFPFTRKYWCYELPAADEPDDTPSNYIQFRDKRSRVFEDEPVGIKKAIEVQRLTKVFSFGWSRPSHVAVNNVTMNVYPGSITCLLGHNGAGKTTTMNMITGMITPTKGSIRVEGFDLYTDTSRARSKMSLCPQHNSLYDELTASEHLFLYAAIKGHPWNELNTTVLETINSISLMKHFQKKPSELSGGMKRKLCLGIALVGGSEIVILDEPSAGLDTEARRGMWDALKRVRHSRTILMTTHDMEEADALSDRIVIMNSGKVVCSGSPMFLKKTLCTGYVLKILKSNEFKHAATLNFIRKLMPKATIKSDIGTEIAYELHESQDSPVELGTFFAELEEQKEKLGIYSFGVTVSTLDEVFLKMGELADNEMGNISAITESQSSINQSTSGLAGSRIIPNGQNANAMPVIPVTGMRLLWSQFRALTIKRINNAKRYWPMMIFQLIIPATVLMIAFLITNPAVTFPLVSGMIHLRPDMYLPGTIFLQFDSKDPGMSEYAEAFEKLVKAQGCNYLKFDPDHNVTEYLLNETSLLPFDLFMSNHIQGVTIESGEKSVNVTSWINVEALHAIPLAIDLIYRAHELRLTDGHVSISSLTNSLLPTYDVAKMKSVTSTNVMWLLFVAISIMFMASSYVLFPISEVSTKAKLIQLMTGLNIFMYHFASFVFDLVSHLTCTLLIILMFYLSDYYGTFTSFSRNYDAMVVLLLLFGACAIIFAYTFANSSASPQQGFLYLQIYYCTTGSVFGILAVTMEFFKEQNIVSEASFDAFIWLMRLSPIFSLSWAFRKIHLNGILKNICGSIDPKVLKWVCIKAGGIFASCCESTCNKNGTDRCIHPNPYGWTGNRIGKELVMILTEFFILLFIFIGIEHYGKICAFFAKKKQLYISETIDEDVLEEKIKIEGIIRSTNTQSEALVVQDLKKKFGKFWAVKGISFTVRRNECFGLLGVNGAGKSTTFGMLTGDILPTSGRIFQGNMEIIEQYPSQFGYCPQINPIIDLLTGRELLFLIARLHGFPESRISPLVNEMIRLVNLENHADKQSGCYSGGNKRKLSIALAMIGNPNLVLLDEPTAGVDPAARRLIWATLSLIREHYNCSIILTSHSMDECEALCSRMAIMVSGEFVCLGSAQHLKSRFGQGYTLNVKLKKEVSNDSEFFQLFTNKLTELMRDVQVVDRHDTFITYRIAKEAGAWSYLFKSMEQLKHEFDLEDYLLSDTTLEQIFINFARKQLNNNHLDT